MKPILAFVALQGGSIKRSTYEVLTLARTIAEQQAAPFHALILASDAGPFVDEVRAYGPSCIHLVEHELLIRHHNEAVVKVLQRAVEEVEPSVLLMPSTEGVKDVLGALAIKASMAAVPDVAAVTLADDHLEAVRPVMAAKFVARVKAKLPAIVSVRAGSYGAEEAERRVEPEIRRISVELDPSRLRARLREVSQSLGGQIDLTDARVVVAAGRGVRDESGKQLIEELAGLFNAAIGSSRAVVENGLFEATTQVGQTGKVVSPDLYFAVGISGAIQHVAGMQNSRVIVAINKDPDAPIFQYATYGIVGDLFKVLPPLIDELRNAVRS